MRLSYASSDDLEVRVDDGPAALPEEPAKLLADRLEESISI